MNEVKQHRLKHMIKVYCAECDNAYYTHESRLEIVMPKDIERNDYFPTRCPICKQDGYSQLIGILADGETNAKPKNV